MLPKLMRQTKELHYLNKITPMKSRKLNHIRLLQKMHMDICLKMLKIVQIC